MKQTLFFVVLLIVFFNSCINKIENTWDDSQKGAWIEDDTIKDTIDTLKRDSIILDSLSQDSTFKANDTTTTKKKDSCSTIKKK